jgi:hypothetical protein
LILLVALCVVSYFWYREEEKNKKLKKQLKTSEDDETKNKTASTHKIKQTTHTTIIPNKPNKKTKPTKISPPLVPPVVPPVKYSPPHVYGINSSDGCPPGQLCGVLPRIISGGNTKFQPEEIQTISLTSQNLNVGGHDNSTYKINFILTFFPFDEAIVKPSNKDGYGFLPLLVKAEFTSSGKTDVDSSTIICYSLLSYYRSGGDYYVSTVLHIVSSTFFSGIKALTYGSTTTDGINVGYIIIGEKDEPKWKIVSPTVDNIVSKIKEVKTFSLSKESSLGFENVGITSPSSNNPLNQNAIYTVQLT